MRPLSIDGRDATGDLLVTLSLLRRYMRMRRWAGMIWRAARRISMSGDGDIGLLDDTGSIHSFSSPFFPLRLRRNGWMHISFG